MVAIAYPPPGAGGAARRRPRPRQAVVARDHAVYRRRRFVAATLTLGVLLGGRWVADVVGSGSFAAPAPAPPVLVGERVHIVQSGDTLWTIARDVQPTGDVRRLVDRLAAARGGASLQVGERIALPWDALP